MSRAKRNWLIYVFFLVIAVPLFIFNYIPMYGVVIAFKEYRINLGIIRSPWNNFKHFSKLFSDPYFWRVFKNTLIISVLRIIFGFPAPIILAILLNEVPHIGVKKIIQSISYLPYFFSWVVIAGIIIEIISPQRGVLGLIYSLIGKEVPILLINKRLFRPFLVFTAMWKSIGWGTIIYLAAMSGINPELYESAAIDGAGRFRMAVRITVPSLIPVITILFILTMSGILNAGFDQIFNLYSPPVYEVADIIDTYVYRQGLINMEFGYATAVGLFKNVIGIALMVGVNYVVRRFSEYGIW